MNDRSNSTSDTSTAGDRSTSFAVTFELLFHKQIQQLGLKFGNSNNLVQTVQELSDEISKVLNSERVTFYQFDPKQNLLIGQLLLTGGQTRELKLAPEPKSIAGYVAMTKRTVNIHNVYDDAELKKLNSNLSFLKGVDARTGFKTRELLAVPVVVSDNLLGVLQIVNSRTKTPFTKLETEGAEALAKSIGGRLIRLQVGGASNNRSHQEPRTTSKYAFLVQSNVISEVDLNKLQVQNGSDDAALENALLTQHRIRSAQIGQSLARFYGVPHEPYQPRRVKQDALHGSLKREMVLRQGWLPLSEDANNSQITVVCLDPEATQASRQVQQQYPKHTQILFKVCTQTEFKDTVDQLIGGGGGGSIDQLLANIGKTAEVVERKEATGPSVADNDMVRLVNKIIMDAYQSQASDIHIEPGMGQDKVQVRLRIDGTLERVLELPAAIRHTLVARIKIMSDLDISESRRPQDGKIAFKKFGALDIELRVATIPSAGGGEDVVMRILAGGEPIPLDDLGLLAQNKERLLNVINKPYGLFYVCGPTGSGKTTTLHSILAYLNTPETKIWTAEDPVEITQKGLRQVQVNKKAGIDFALLMRAFLRADPDIIMVGESRDHETVSMGVEASLTGHLVFSTLHTNSAPESITRLLDMGMDPFNFSDALLGVLAQRLAKRLCRCKEEYFPDDHEIRSFMTEYANELKHTTAWQQDYNGEIKKLYAGFKDRYGSNGRMRLYKAVGCDECRGSGYRGRLGLHELLVADETLKGLIQERSRVSTLFTASVQGGMLTLKMDGMEKALMGLTDMKQVRAVCIK